MLIAKFKIILILLPAILLWSCDKGLEPPAPVLPSYIKGQIIYKGGKSAWPSKDSLKDLRVVFFKEFPDSASILNDYLSGNLTFSDSTLAFFQDSTEVMINIKNAPVTYKYIAVGQNYGTLLDWRVVGLYSNDGVTPKTLYIPKNGTIDNFRIEVDFFNPPPQPF